MTLTYAEVGGTQGGPLPAGYDHTSRHVRIGAGRTAYAVAAEALARWQPQRGAGLRVRTDLPRPAVGVRFTVGVRLGPLTRWAPCEVVWVVEEADRYGFGFGTLPGHPVHGEEAFVVSLDGAGAVWFDIRAFSRPARWFVRAGGPVVRRVQQRITDRYVDAMRQSPAEIRH